MSLSLPSADSLAIARRFAALSEAGRAELKARLRARGLALASLPLVPMPGEEGGTAPLSFEQERLWFLWRLAPETAADVMAGALRLTGALSPAHLRSALAAVVSAHESLRTRFLDVEGEGRQRIDPAPNFGWAETEIGEDGLAAALERAVLTPFDLEAGPVFRAALLRLGPEDHVLVLALHHIVGDGWSIDILLRDLARAYAGEPVPAGRLRYADYALWQRALQDEAESTAALNYWRAALGQEIEPLRLPQDRVRGAVRSPAGARVTAEVTGDLAARLRALAHAEGVTLPTLLLAAWGALLHRYAGQREIRIGLPHAGRARAEVRGILGLFVNTLVLRAEISPETDFRSLLAQQRARMAEALSHADLPFARVVEALGIARSLSETPVFQTIFNHQAAEAERHLSLGDLVVSDQAGLPVTAVTDLALDVFDRGGALRLAMTYAVDILGPETGQSLLDAYLALLGAVVAAPGLRIGAIPLPGAEPGPRAASHAYRPVTARLAEAASRYPASLALTCGEEKVDHARLARWSDAIAARLEAAGVAPEVPVGLCVTRSAGMVAALIGILKAGGAYLPLDPDFPSARLAAMVADAGLRHVVADQAATEALGAVLEGCAIISPADGAGQPSAPVPLPGQLAYVIYTSGSTGTPKGVGISHGALSLHFDDFTKAFDYGPGDVGLQFSTINFDAAAEQMLPLLAVGGHVVLRGSEAWTPADLTAAVTGEKLTIADVPTAFWQEWARDLPQDTHLRRVTVGGEALAGDHLALWRRGPLGSVRLDNRYGPTETTMSALYHQTMAIDEQATLVPIGRPYPGRSARVVDAAGDRLPAGGTGELCIGGESLARGYLDRPGLTAAYFVPDEEGAPGARLYRSGDLCRLQRNGTVAFLGRADGQVKLRGFRIELGEIEAALRAQSGVAEAAVALRGAGDAARLVGYVVGELDMAALPTALGRRLPAHMVPAAFMRLQTLPMTPTGKLDYRALPEPPAAMAQGRAAQTEAEAVLCSVIARLLDLAEVSPEDDFFRLGGDSILSLRLVARARQAGLALTPRLIFEHPRIADLSAHAGQDARSRPDSASHGPVPLSPIQVEFFRRHPEGRHWWNQSALFRATGPLDETRLAAALAALAARHEALRLRFQRNAAGGWQAVPGQPLSGTAEAAFPFEHVTVEDDPASLVRAGALIQAGLDITAGPIARAAWLSRPDGTAHLLIVIHHLVVDGVSWRILMDDLASLYAGRALPPAPDWGQWARGQAAFAERLGVEDAAPWRDQSQEARAWPPAPRTLRAEARRLVSHLDAGQTAALLREAGRALRTTPEDLLLTALARAVSRISGQPDTLVMLEGHGREEIVPGLDLSAIIGWFTTQYPVRLPGLGEPLAGLAAVKDGLRALPHRGLTWGLLPPALRSDTALPTIAFNYLGRFETGPEAADGLPLVLAAEAHGAALDPQAPLDHALDVTASVTGGCLSLVWTACPHSLGDAALRDLVLAFEAELTQLIDLCCAAPPGATAGDFPLAHLEAADLARLAPQLGDIEDIYPATPLQQGMLAQALRVPGGGFYVGQLHLTLGAELDPAALHAAFGAVIARHAVLRTGFDLRGAGGAMQLVHGAASLPIARLDWADAGSGYSAALSRFLDEDRARGFDITAPPLMRVTLILRPDGGHDLIWTSHHALLDGWSQSRLLGEIAAAYEAIRAGGAPAFAPVRPYRDYIAWLARQSGEAAEGWWRAQLAGPEPALLGPTLSPPETREEGQSEAEMRLSAQTSARLREAARAHGVTLGTVLQGAWALLLARRAGRPGAAFGVTLSGRPPELEGVEAMLGLFINSLPLHVAVPADAELWPWLGALQRLTGEMRQHEQTPLPDILRVSGAPVEALFDTLLVFENYPIDAAARAVTGDLAPQATHQRERTQYPLTLMIQEKGEAGLLFRWLWDRSRVGAEDAAGLQRDLAHILAWMTEVASPRLSELAFPQPAPEPARHHAFRSVLARIAEPPDMALALTYGGEHLSYGALRAWASGLAAHLGAAPEERIGLCAARGPALVAAMLGIMATGAAYVPLDPAYPPARLAAILADAGIRRVVTDATGRLALPDDCTGGDCTVIDMAEVPLVDGQLGRAPHPEQLAYVIHTSGSTGTPKGVGISHAALARLFDATSGFALSPRDVWTLFHSYAFDFSVWEIFGALCHGGRLVIVPAETARDPQAFHALLRAERVTVLNQTPSAFAPLAEIDSRSDTPLRDLRLLVFGGETLDPRIVARWRRAGAPRIVNMYGITETTVHVTARDLTGTERASLIGPPLDDLSVHLLNQDGLLVPRTGMGEIAVGGAGLARGYLGRPGLTAERFLPDPWGPPGSRLYRAGDLARRDEAGEIAALGRADGQVKLRGFRIELSEIEVALRDHPGVAQAAVVLADGRLAAYYVGEAEPVALMTALAARLPAHMVPASIQPLAALPLTLNGKLDRAALPAPERQVADGFEAPRSETERHLAEAVAAVLGLPRVSMTADFFRLGGDSLSAMRLAARLSASLGQEVPLAALFARPTLREFAASLTEEGDSAPIPRRQATETGPFPLSHEQARLWFLWRLAPEAPAYTMAGAVRLRGALDAGRLHAALRTVVLRHESLRTRFVDRAGEGWQMVEPEPRFGWQEQALPAAQWAEALGPIATAPFDLITGPVFRAALLRASPEDAVLLLAMHHIVSDGWSVDLLLRDLAAAYEGQSLPTPAIQYADYALWQNREEGRFAADLAYWRQRLAGPVELLRLPVDRARGAARGLAGGSLSGALSADVMQPLRALAAAEGATLFALLLAAWAALLARYAGQGMLRIGIPIALRHRPEVQETVGLFLNTLVLQADIQPGMTFRTLLRQQQRRLVEAHAHADLPFARLVEHLGLPRSLSETPLFQTMLNLEQAASLPAPAGLAAEPWPLAVSTARTDLALNLVETGDALQAQLTYAADILDAATAERLLSGWLSLLQHVAMQPDTRLSSLHIEDAPRLAAPAAYVFDPAQARVARAAARLGDCPALSCDEDRLSHANLDAWSDTVAARLMAAGVGPESRVGLAVTRGPGLVAGLLGILKAGGAFLPLDLDHPRDRLRQMVEDASPVCILTDAAGPALGQIAGGVPLCLLPPRDERVGFVSRPVHPEQLAYVLYTSGSTGRPKGVAVSHRALSLHLDDFIASHGVSGADVVLNSSTVGFDVALHEILPALIQGGRVVMRGQAPWTLEGLTATLAAEEVTFARIPTALWQQWLASAPPPLPALRQVTVGGEGLPGDALPRWFASALCSAALDNLYGPTETTVAALRHRVIPRDEDSTIVPIGQPYPGRTAVVRDAEGEAAPRGGYGELCIGGFSLARGYLGRPGLTAERFVPDPEGLPGSRLYRTGDLCRRQADGGISFHGRLDRQVKLRGHRIELGEIEAALRAQPGLSEAVVDLRGEGEAARLVAYVVSEAPLDEAALRQALGQRLPAPMLPGAFMRLTHLPISPTGKLDRAALPEAEAPESAGRSPATAAEARLCAIVAALLGRAQVSPADNFFGLGGESLTALRLVSACEAAGLTHVTLAAIFAAPDLAFLAAAGDRPPGLVALNGGGRTPLFCLHPSYGSTADYAGLARRLEGGFAVHGLDSPALGETGWQGRRFADLAAHHVAQMRVVQPRGPYHLLGWSLGGWLAVEIAHQLERSGETVAFLGIVDTLAVAMPDTITETDGLDDEAAIAHLRQAGAGHLIPDRLAQADRATLHRAVAAFRLHNRLLEGYRLPAIQASIHLWWSEDTACRYPDLMNWRALAPQAGEGSVLAGTTHLTILQQPEALSRIAAAIAAECPA